MAAETSDSLPKDDLKPQVLELLAQIKALVAQNRLLLARIAELEARADQPPKTPSNSSVPPSKGHKTNRPEKAGKRRPHVRATTTSTFPSSRQ